MPKKASPKPSRGLTGAHRLIQQSWRLLNFNRRRMAMVLLVLLVVNWAIRFASSGATSSLYQGVWYGFASCSLIWAIRHHQEKKLKTAAIYWVGTAPALKFFIVISIVGLVSLPFSIGAFVFSTVNYLSAGTSPLALLLAGGGWVALSILSLLLLARLLPALIVATLPDVGPFTALRLSWRLTKKQTFVVAARLLVLFIYTAAILFLVTLAFSALKLSQNIIQIGTEVVGLGFLLPLFFAYIFLIYKELA